MCQVGIPGVFKMYPFVLHSVSMSIFASIIGPFGGFFASGFKRAFKIKVWADFFSVLWRCASVPIDVKCVCECVCVCLCVFSGQAMLYKCVHVKYLDVKCMSVVADTGKKRERLNGVCTDYLSFTVISHGSCLWILCFCIGAHKSCESV